MRYRGTCEDLDLRQGPLSLSELHHQRVQPQLPRQRETCRLVEAVADEERIATPQPLETELPLEAARRTARAVAQALDACPEDGLPLAVVDVAQDDELLSRGREGPEEQPA